MRRLTSLAHFGNLYSLASCSARPFDSGRLPRLLCCFPSLAVLSRRTGFFAERSPKLASSAYCWRGGIVLSRSLSLLFVCPRHEQRLCWLFILRMPDRRRTSPAGWRFSERIPWEISLRGEGEFTPQALLGKETPSFSRGGGRAKGIRCLWWPSPWRKVCAAENCVVMAGSKQT